MSTVNVGKHREGQTSQFKANFIICLKRDDQRLTTFTGFTACEISYISTGQTPFLPAMS